MGDNTFTVIGDKEAWDRYVAGKYDKRRKSSDEKDADYRKELEQEREKRRKPVRQWMDAEQRKAIVTGAGFEGAVYNKGLLLKLDQQCDIEERIIAEYNILLKDADYDGVYNIVAHNMRNYHKGRNSIFSCIMYDIGVYHKPPSKVIGGYKVQPGDMYENGRFNALSEIRYIMGTIHLDQSSELYDAEWSGNQCPFVSIGSEITVEVKDYKDPNNPTYKKVKILEFLYSPDKIGQCRVYDKLRLARCDDGQWYNVTNCPETDCTVCYKLNGKRG